MKITTLLAVAGLSFAAIADELPLDIEEVPGNSFRQSWSQSRHNNQFDAIAFEVTSGPADFFMYKLAFPNNADFTVIEDNGIFYGLGTAGNSRVRFDLSFDSIGGTTASWMQEFSWKVTYFSNGEATHGWEWRNYDKKHGLGYGFGGKFFALESDDLIAPLGSGSSNSVTIPLPTTAGLAAVGLFGLTGTRRRSA